MHVLAQRERDQGPTTPLTFSAMYAIGAAMSGSVIGWSVSVLGQGLSGSAYTTPITIAMLAILAAREFGWVAFPLPELRFQVPAPWVAFAPWQRGFIWGTVLGVGFLTFIRFGAFWAYVVVLFATGTPHVGFVGGLVYGLARSFPSGVVALTPALHSRWLQPTAEPIFRRAATMRYVGAIAILAAAGLLSIGIVR